MISKEEAYLTIKNYSDVPITYMLETADSFYTTTEEMLSLSKQSGKISKMEKYLDFMVEAQEGKHVFLTRLFDDFLAYYIEHPEEATLAELYARSWNRLFYDQEEEPFKYNSYEERQQILSKWEEIVQLLYNDIRKITDTQNLSRPPCVQDHSRDLFYMAKPFMIKHGWTTNDVNRIWTRI